MKFSDSQENSSFEGAPIDLTSMIDVLFVLLLFFMISTTFSSLSGLELNLPKSKSNLEQQEESALSVFVSKDAGFYLSTDKTNYKTKRLTEKELFFEMSLVKDKSKLVLNADKDISHGEVVRILDRAKSLGFEKFSIATSVETD